MRIGYVSRTVGLVCLGLSCLSAGAGRLAGQESTDGGQWPQWRGGDFSSFSSSTGLPLEFGPGKNCLWKVPMPGRAGSSPVVWDDRVYVTSVTEDERGLVLLAFDPSGKELWRRPLKGENQNYRDDANSAAASPLTDGRHVWATSGAGGLSCFTVEGEEVWTVDLQQEYGEFRIQFGMSSTPILHDGRLYLQLIHGEMRGDDPGTGLVLALDANTGALVWKQNRESAATFENRHSYASPTLYSDGKQAFLLTHGADWVVAHDLADGRELWRCGGLNDPENYNPTLRFVSSPACSPGLVVVPTAKNGPVLGLKPGGSGDLTDRKEWLQWKLQRGTPDVASPVIHDGLVYLFRENGVVVCVDAVTGEEVWNQRMLADMHRSTPVAADGHLFVTGRDGVVTVLKAGRKPSVVASNQLPDPITASPAIANGRIYIRSFGTLFCFQKADAGN